MEAVRWKNVMGCRGDWRNGLVMAAARRYCGMSLREIGEATGGKDYAAVSIAIKRFQQRMAEDRNMADRMKRLEGMLNVET